MPAVIDIVEFVKGAEPVQGTSTANATPPADTDRAFIFGLRDPQSSEYSAATFTKDATKTRIALTPTGGSPVNYDFALATYTSMALIQTAWAVDEVVGRQCYWSLDKCLEETETANLLDVAAGDIRTNAGLNVYIDNSADDYSYLVINSTLCTALRGEAQGPENIPPVEVPDRPDPDNQDRQLAQQRVMVTDFSFVLNAASGTLGASLYATSHAGGDRLLQAYTSASSSPAMTATTNPFGFLGNQNERIVARGGDGSTAITSTNGVINGFIGAY